MCGRQMLHLMMERYNLIETLIGKQIPLITTIIVDKMKYMWIIIKYRVIWPLHFTHTNNHVKSKQFVKQQQCISIILISSASRANTPALNHTEYEVIQIQIRSSSFFTHIYETKYLVDIVFIYGPNIPFSIYPLSTHF